MLKRSLRRLVLPVLAVSAALVFAAPAAATTWCVPDFSQACPEDGENQVPVSGTTPGEKLDAAMSNGLASDGVPDRILLAPDTYTVPGTFKAQGNDGLEIVGAGRGETVITSSSSGNIFVVNLYPRNALVTVRDLTVIIPESFPDGGGSGYGTGIQSGGDRLERVDLINSNPGSTGLVPVAGGHLVDVRITSDNDSKTSYAISGDSCLPGELKLDRVEVEWSTRAIRAKCASMPITINGLRVRHADTVMSVAQGSLASVTNAVIAAGEASPFRLESPAATPTALALDHVTMVGDPNWPNPAIRAITTGDSGLLTVGITNSVITGFSDPWDLLADPAPASGHIDLEASYSFFDHPGTAGGDATVTANTDTNIIGEDAGKAPGFADTGHRLSPDSALVDAGDPAQAVPDTDIEGNIRPLDGNDDGAAVRDIGAYEYVPPPPLPSPVPISAAGPLRVKFVKFRYRTRRGGRLVLRVNRKARLRVTLTPIRKRRATGDRRRRIKLTRLAKAGRVTIRLRKRRLGKGRYRLKVVATARGGPGKARLARTVRAR